MSDERLGRIQDYLTGAKRERTTPNQRPRDAATLILIDRTGREPKVLMGKRHPGHKFMPGKFVFPGGRIEPDDRRMPSADELAEPVSRALSARLVAAAAGRGRALALTAIRETYEETGLALGTRVEAMPKGPGERAWKPFFELGVLPALAAMHFVGRAITPPRRPRRFDTRFFAVDRSAVAHEAPGFTGPDKELVELVWVEIAEARRLDLPPITVAMLEELEARAAAGFGHDLPVPFYFERRGRFQRELL
ncbi:MAG: NUDIX domain-containing protein [Methylobacteriaceae bacterium]|nr:NUDIX domain-containing protein [Methylobacteriaceae bacterium]